MIVLASILAARALGVEHDYVEVWSDGATARRYWVMTFMVGYESRQSYQAQYDIQVLHQNMSSTCSSSSDVMRNSRRAHIAHKSLFRITDLPLYST